MTLLLVASALAALGLLTLLHLRATGTRSAEAIPSLQHLRGPSPRRRRALPLEEFAPWALRSAALLLAALGVWASRSGCSADVRPLVVVDPSASTEAWDRALGLAGAKGVLGFEGDAARANGDVPPRVLAALEACSGTRAACLLRAADSALHPLVLVGAFEAAEWRLALTQSRRAFSFVRAGKAKPPAEETPSPAPPLAHVRLEGTSRAAQVWAAALAVAAHEGDAPEKQDASPPLPVVTVVDATTAAADAPTALTVVAVEAPSAAQPYAPAVEAHAGTGLLLRDPLDLAAGLPGLGLSTSLAFLPDARFSEVLGLAALRSTTSGAQLALAATPEELGDWAHRGSLVPLTRSLLAAALPGPTVVRTAPSGDGLSWTDGEGGAAPVGLVDVHPGEYLRADGRVALQLARATAPGQDALDDAELERLGGHPFVGPDRTRPPWPALLFLGALLAWLSGVWLTRRARRAWLFALAVAVGLALLALDVGWPGALHAPWTAVLALPPGPARAELSALARKAGVVSGEGADAPSLPCAAASAPGPCTPLATVGLAAAPAVGVDTLLFDTTRPRVDILSVEAPREVPLGTAAEVWVTVRVRRASGQRLTLTTRCSAAAPFSRQLEVDGPDVARTVPLTVAPLSEGVAFVAVEAAVAGEAQAQDGRLFALSARERLRERLVLAAAPGWEARAAAAALEASGVRVQSLTLLGTRAVVATGRGALTPREVLGSAEALRGVGLLALSGFAEKDLDGPAAVGLRQYVASGGAALVLDAPGAAAALGIDVPAVAATAALQPLEGQLQSEEAVHFRGYAPAAALKLPAGISVLGRLGSKEDKAPLPWVVGRAFGKGRVAVVTAPDMWRLSPPGKGREAYQRVLSRLVGWLEAPAASRGGVTLSEDWASLRVEDGASTRDVPLPTSARVAGLPVDAVELPTFLLRPRARLRAAATAVRHPFLELEGPGTLEAAWQRLPPAPRWRQRVPLRESDAAFTVLSALLVLEAMARRLYGGRGGSGRRARTAPSSEDTGGTASGEGSSQRASATPAVRAAALRETSSFAA